MRTVSDSVGRIYEFWCGRQRVAGKTTALRARVRWAARKPSVNSVWVFDRLNEWSRPENVRRLGVTDVVVYRSLSDYLNDDKIRRVVLWNLGAAAAAYDRCIAEAVALGDVMLVLDEAYEFADSGAAWTGSEVLRSVVFAGAHLARRSDGDMRPTHLVVATQYPKSVHYQIWQQAYTVMVGVLAGASSIKWVKDNFGEETEDRVRALRSYEWECVHGERPEMPGYGPQG